MLLQAVKSWKEGRQSQEETAIQRWQRLAREAEDQKDIAEQDEAYAIILANYWRQRSADLEYVMRSEGIAIPPPHPMPNKRRMRGVSRGSRRSMASRATPTADEQDFSE